MIVHLCRNYVCGPNKKNTDLIPSSKFNKEEWRAGTNLPYDEAKEELYELMLIHELF